MGKDRPGASRKEWEKAQKEKRIIDIAREVFVEKGFEKTGIPAVAEAAGYNRRTIYLYFRDKEELFMAVVLHCMTMLRDRMADAAEKIRSEGTGLSGVARAFFAFAQEHPAFMDLIMVYESRHFVYHESERNRPLSERQAACQAVSQELSDLVTATLENAIQRGALRTDLAPRPLMLLLWGQILGVTQILRIREKHFDAVFGMTQEDLFNHFLRMMETSLVKE
ncbi:MAG: TetR/AcrR family transcriptional regulator [Desulfobacter sp.]|nr:MAG: TetR/AcrR family transcriptional regulator [Desulfobacter sp.]